MKKKKNPNGRPPKYKTPEALQEKINDYFKNGVTVREQVVTNQKSIFIPVITITGLVLHLGYSSRQSFYDLAKNKEFAYTIRKARMRVEQHYEELLQFNSGSNIQFALKNIANWTDKTELEVTERKYVHIEFKDMTPDQLEEEAQRINGLLASHIRASGEN